MGIRRKNESPQVSFFYISVTLPVELKKDGNAFIINFFFDHGRGEVSTKNFHVVSQGLLLGFLKKDIFKNWNLLGSFILRRNKEAEKKLDDDWQYGGIILTIWKKNQFTALKFGLYNNKEFFGNYFMPLAGIDWQINGKNNLFGVLPGT